MTTRLLVLVGVALACGLLLWARARWHQGGAATAPGATVPAGLVPEGRASWLVLTTPWCAACRPVVERLEAEGELPVVVVDVAERPDVGRALDVRHAPTVLRVDAGGGVLERQVGGGVTAVAS